jgi:Ca2+-binding RTX toxin-like protein
MALVIGTENGEILEGGPVSDLLLGLGGEDELHGREGSDLLDGGKDRDRVFGEEGDDLLVGGTGPASEGPDDLLDGGPGSDWVIYTGQSAIVDLSTGEGDSNFAVDQLVSIENVAASGILIGDAGDNILVGLGLQPDFFSGGAGNDLIIGSDAVHPGGFPNFDTVGYDQDPAGVVVNLATGEAIDGYCGLDRISGVEAVWGSQFDDCITGNFANNQFLGGAGEDVIQGLEGSDLMEGGPGVDLLDGGEGSDWVVTSGPDTIDLAAGTATDPFSGEIDTLASIENVLSFGFDSVLIGDDGANRFATFDSNSRITGGEGPDRFLQLAPGSGFAIDTVTDFERGADLLQFEAGAVAFDQLLPEGPLDPAFFAIGAAADEDDYFVFDPVNGLLSIDRDGSGEGEAVPSILLEGETELAASDIEIIPADFLGSFVLGDEVLV